MNSYSYELADFVCALSSSEDISQPQLQLQFYPNYAKCTIESVEKKN